MKAANNVLAHFKVEGLFLGDYLLKSEIHGKSLSLDFFAWFQIEDYF